MKPIEKLPRVMTGWNFIKIAILWCIIYLCLTSCYTKKQAVAKFCHPDTVTATVNIDTTLKSKAAETGFTVNCDSLISRYDSMARRSTDTVVINDTVYVPGKPSKIIPQKGVLIYSDSLVNVYYSVNSKGNLSFKVQVKPQDVSFKASYDVKVPVTVPNQTLSNMGIVRAARWFLVIAFFMGISVGLYLQFRRS